MKKSKKITSKTNDLEYDPQRETRVLLEDLSHSVSLLAEGQMTLIHRFDGLENKFDGLENRFSRMEHRFDTVEHRLSNVESELKSVKLAVFDNRHHINELRKDQNSGFKRLDQRLLKLEMV